MGKTLADIRKALKGGGEEAGDAASKLDEYLETAANTAYEVHDRAEESSLEKVKAHLVPQKIKKKKKKDKAMSETILEQAKKAQEQLIQAAERIDALTADNKALTEKVASYEHKDQAYGLARKMVGAGLLDPEGVDTKVAELIEYSEEELLVADKAADMASGGTPETFAKVASAFDTSGGLPDDPEERNALLRAKFYKNMTN